MRTFFFTLSTILLLSFSSSRLQLKAEGICDFVPCANYGGFCPNGDCDALGSVNNLIRIGLSFIFVIIIILGVGMIVRAALKIIRSEGDDKKIQEGMENIRGVMFGVIILFVGIIGIVLISVLFNATGIFGTDVEDPPLVDVPVL